MELLLSESEQRSHPNYSLNKRDPNPLHKEKWR